MNSNSIIIKEYLSSLKEDQELDILFPALLSVMGFRVVQTPTESKGQPQYGKDIIATGKDERGKKFRWYFELKGHKDKDINDTNFVKPDGIRDSIIAAKYAAFNDSSIPDFNKLPIKIITVHNGVLKSNTRPTFEGFISKEFENEEQYERWDIYYLTELFEKYMFGEYLLADNESNRLFKRTLAFLDAPDNNYNDLNMLINLQISKVENIKGRALTKFFATMNLISSIIFHYSKENDNLIAAKKCTDLIILKTWAWILSNKLENKKAVTGSFRKLLETQYIVLNEYFRKTFPVASIENGLYAENGHIFEIIGYPLRCYEYLNDLVYYCNLRHHLPDFSDKTKAFNKLRIVQKDKIIDLINNNSGFNRPIIDNHSISILNLVLFFSERSDMRRKDIEFTASFILRIIEGLILIKNTKGRLPEGYNKIELVAEYIATGERPYEYTDESSMLIAIILELLVMFNLNSAYELLKKGIGSKISLQIAHPNTDEYDIEMLLFEKHLDEEYYVVTDFDLPDDFEDFKKSVLSKKINHINYRTDTAGFLFLRMLAHNYYKNEIFPDEWRRLLKDGFAYYYNNL